MFIKDVMQVHLSSNELQKFESIKGVRERLREFIDYDSALFTHALDEICRNTVGVALFRLFLTKRAPGAPKIKIENIGPAQQVMERIPGIQNHIHLYFLKSKLVIYTKSKCGSFRVMQRRGTTCFFSKGPLRATSLLSVLKWRKHCKMAKTGA
jgi:hypothetical protein